MEKHTLLIRILTAGYQLVGCSDYNNLVFSKTVTTEGGVTVEKKICVNMTSGAVRASRKANGKEQTNIVCTNAMFLVSSPSGEVITDMNTSDEFAL